MNLAGPATRMRHAAHALVMAKRHLTGSLDVPELALLRRFIAHDSTCLDIGAHAGSWSRPLSRLAPEGIVYSFEALPYYADVLRILFRLLHLSNARVVNVAVSDRQGVLKIAWKDEQGRRLTGTTHVLGSHEAAVSVVEVPSVSLDHFVARERIARVDFIKVDVEGAEMFVYAGARGLLHRCRPVVFCELDERWTARYDYDTDKVFDLFESLGYGAYTITGAAKALRTDRHTYSRRGDVLFVPDGKRHLLGVEG
ncbi:FkbM family methyltransferase [Ramlibacter sp.]|uniref:FkbM family methyltransferase n=1 Tax=Ramlibacter sp. TaxID=1917967 RepID=UPI002FCB902C